MSTDSALDQLSRDELVSRARALGARRPEVMTRVELRDEIVRLSEPDPQVRRRSRGWLGVARDLVASVVDAGLNMPTAAAAIRGDARPAEETTGPPPVATLTLAEIYLAQGHTERALATLEEVLAAEPQHAAALALRDRIGSEHSGAPGRHRPAPPSEPSSADEPVPAPAPFVASAQPSFVASVPSPEATRAPDVAGLAPPVDVPAELPWEADTTVGPPAPPETEEFAARGSSPDSQPAPTLAAPPVGEEAFSEPVPAAPPPAQPECALLERAGTLEGLYSLPPSASGVVLRLAWFVPSHEGPSVGTVDVPLDPVRTRISLPRVAPSAHVRAALGTDVAGIFRPLAVACVYRESEGALSVAFAPPAGESVLLRAEAQALARASHSA